MLRPRAVRQMLVEVAGARLDQHPAEGEGTTEAGGGRSLDEVVAAEHEAGRQALDRARRRALFTVVFDALAIVVLLVLRDGERFLTLGRNEDTIFTLGVLAVAVHLGFRLAQLLALGTVRRLHDELGERES
jgi:hypothetical protein